MARAVAVALALTFAAPAEAATWRWPARGPVTARFHVTADRFARGQHRGIDIAAAAGAPVTAACAGRVRFAGSVGRNGRTVSVLCGPLVATYTHLRRIAVRRGERLRAGDRVGTAGPRLHLGARRATDRDGYIDPLTLLGDPTPPPPDALPFTRPRPARPLAPAPAPVRSVRVDVRSPVHLPWTIYAGLLLLAPVASLPLLRGGRRGPIRRRTPRTASPPRPAAASRRPR